MDAFPVNVVHQPFKAIGLRFDCTLTRFTWWGMRAMLRSLCLEWHVTWRHRGLWSLEGHIEVWGRESRVCEFKAWIEKHGDPA